jgi:hypothetical protein
MLNAHPCGGPDALSEQECSLKDQMTALAMEETCLKNVILTASLPIFSSDTSCGHNKLQCIEKISVESTCFDMLAAMSCCYSQPSQTPSPTCWRNKSLLAISFLYTVACQRQDMQSLMEIIVILWNDASG